jgi:succinate-semialdehyde dehydrogenase/glutarate-semialdehyde dehydrogenase
VADALARGGKVVCGGEKLPRAGHFFPPTVVTGLPDDSLLMTEEPFGPVAPIVSFSTREEGVRRANNLPFGLASYVFTESLSNATYASDRIEAGMVNVNHFGIALAETPFGGVKDSGLGHEGGQETFDGYLVTKFISSMSSPCVDSISAPRTARNLCTGTATETITSPRSLIRTRLALWPSSACCTS